MKTQQLLSVVILSVLFVLSACNQEGMYKKRVKTYDNSVYGTLHNKKLFKNAVIDSYPCRKGKVSLYHDGKLQSFTLSEDHEINGVIVPKGSWVQMYYTGYPEFITLKGDIIVNGYNIPKNQGFTYWHVSFYNDGSLSSFKSSEDVQINKIPCAKRERIQLYPDGNLWTCVLSDDFDNGEEMMQMGWNIILDENQSVHRYSDTLWLQLNKRLDVAKYTHRYYGDGSEK